VPKLGYLVEWESHASWICLPNGLGSAIFLAFLRGKRIRTESLQPIISVSGNGILRLENKAPKLPSNRRCAVSETKRKQTSRQFVVFARFQEISASDGLRGGPGQPDRYERPTGGGRGHCSEGY